MKLKKPLFVLTSLFFLGACVERTDLSEPNPDDNDPPFAGDEMNPSAFDLATDPFVFNFWAHDEPDGAFPASMVFQQTDIDDPMLADEMTEPYNVPHDDYNSDDEDTIGFPYNNTRRTRINGLNENGVSFINTGRGRDLGAAVVGLQTLGRANIRVSFTAETMIPNSRVYNLRLQYRVGTDGLFKDVIENGEPVEYKRNETPGHEQDFGPVTLPEEVNDQEYVQVRWKYYFTGERVSEDSGARAMIRLDNVLITSDAL